MRRSLTPSEQGSGLAFAGAGAGAGAGVVFMPVSDGPRWSYLTHKYKTGITL